LRWRNVTNDTEFVNLSSDGELTFNADTVLVDGSRTLIEDHMCSVHPTYTWMDGEEVEGDGSGPLEFLEGTFSEVQYAVDCDNAISGCTYEFEIYDATQSQVIGTCLATISIIGSSSSSSSLSSSSSSSSASSSSSRSSVSSSRSSSSASSSSSSRRGKTYRFRSRARFFKFNAKA
jgi:cobalamin biosynthesis Mg chelatase CobN